MMEVVVVRRAGTMHRHGAELFFLLAVHGHTERTVTTLTVYSNIQQIETFPRKITSIATIGAEECTSGERVKKSLCGCWALDRPI